MFNNLWVNCHCWPAIIMAKACKSYTCECAWPNVRRDPNTGPMASLPNLFSNDAAHSYRSRWVSILASHKACLEGMKRAECHFLQLSLNIPRACMLPPQKPGNAQNLNFAFGRISRLLAGLSRKRAMIHNDSHHGAVGHGYMVVVVSTHLKKMLVKLDHFPR